MAVCHRRTRWPWVAPIDAPLGSAQHDRPHSTYILLEWDESREIRTVYDGVHPADRPAGRSGRADAICDSSVNGRD